MASNKKDLKKSVSTLRGELMKTRKKLAQAKNNAERWKREARAQRSAAARQAARVDKLRKKLDRAAAALVAAEAAAPMQVAAPGRPAIGLTAAESLTVPDESWTVVRLRAEARARGLVGMSNKPKADLLAALT